MKLTEANHAIRNRNVTASEVGALLGEHPYTTPGQIWDRLMLAPIGFLPAQKPPTPAMRFGSEAEPILRRLAAESIGAPIRMNARTFEHPRVRLCATPDAILLDGSWHGRALVEFKLSFSQWRWSRGLPKDIEWQARAQLACTSVGHRLKRDRCIIYVFHGTETIYVVERDRGRERRMTQSVEAFWNDYVVTGIRPADPTPAEVVV